MDAEFDAIVASVYRAAAGELPWGESLQAMAAVLPAWGVQLHGVRLADGAVAFSYDVGGFPPEGILAYITQYHAADRRTGQVLRNPPLEWFNCHEHFDDATVAADPFYQDFLIPYGGRWASGANVYQDNELIAIFGIHRNPAMGPLPPRRRGDWQAPRAASQHRTRPVASPAAGFEGSADRQSGA